MIKKIFLFILLLPTLLFSQDARKNNHGSCIIPYQDDYNTTYYLTWSSSYATDWEHDIYNETIYFDESGNLIISTSADTYIIDEEAQEPVNASINTTNNTILSVWEDGSDTDAPNIKGQLHAPDGSILKTNWVIAGGTGAQHSASTSHLGNKFLICYADEAPPATAGAVLKAKVIDDVTGEETQTIHFSPNNEDHWWPVSTSNKEQNRTLIIWGNDGYATRGSVLYENEGVIQEIQPSQDYLTNTQQYYYQVEWLEEIAQFLLIARNGAYDAITDQSQICLIDTAGNITNTAILAGGIIREAKMTVKWSESNQIYSVFYPSGTNNLTHFSIDNTATISEFSNQIMAHPDLFEMEWASTGIWATFVKSLSGNDLFDTQHIALFIMNDPFSDNLIKIPIHLNINLFTPTGNTESILENKIKIFPNPTSDKIFLPYLFQNKQYKIYTTLGNLVQSGFSKSNTIDFTQLSKGVYYLKLKDHAIFFKIIKY